MHLCKFCSKECSTAHSVRAHQAVCKSNPAGKNPADWATGNRKGIPSWNAGLAGDERLKHTEESKRLMSIRAQERTAEWHAENGKRISESIRKKVKEGTWHTSLAKHMHINYNGEDLHGSWEHKFAIYCDANGIEWKRNKDSFAYTYDGKERRYTPDFYLPESDEYIEIKGYKTDKDDAKWSQFPSHRTLVVLMRGDLERLLGNKL